MDAPHGPALDVLSRLCIGLAGLCVAAAVVSTLAGSEDGLLIGPFFGIPTLVLGVALRSTGRRTLLIAGVAGLVWATFNVLVVVGNWSGYDARGRALAPMAVAPFVVIGLGAFLLVYMTRRAPR